VDIKAIAQRQYGPMPVWAWAVLGGSVIAGIYVFNKQKKGTTVPTGGGTTVNTGGDPSQFQSGISTTTTDPNGNTITTDYSASGPNSFMPGSVFQAGGMPYQSGGDVYVNYPGGTAPPPQATTQNLRQKLDVNKFNAASQGGANSASPWYMTVANTGESWLDITARVYGYGDNYADVKPADQARVKDVAQYIQNSNNAPGSTGNGPAPEQVVFFR
jgi:hypothetical protein